MTLTRNTLLRLPIIHQSGMTKIFGINESISQKFATQGTGYQIVLKYKGEDSWNYSNYYVSTHMVEDCEDNTIYKDISKLHNYTAYEFKSFNEAVAWAKKHIDFKAIHLTNYCWKIMADYVVYSYQKKTTLQKEVAESWFKNYRILDNNYDFVWYLIEPGVDYIDLSLFQYSSTDNTVKPYKIMNHVTRESIDYIVRINNDGHILGCVHITPTGRRVVIDGSNYSYGWHNAGSGCMIDAYHKIIKSNGNHDKFSKETMKALKDAGFQDIYWLSNWGTHERCVRLNDLYTLENYNNRYYHSDTLDTDRSKEICDYLKDIPFDEDHLVVPFKNGFIARFGKLLQAFQKLQHGYDRKTGRYIYQPSPDTLDTCDVDTSPAYHEFPDSANKGKFTKQLISPILDERFVEGTRLWISNTFSIRSVCVSKCAGKYWNNTRIDLCDSRWGDDSAFAPANPDFTTESTPDVEAFNKKVYEKLFAVHPKLKYLTGYTEKHPSLYRGNDIKFLRSLFKYQNIIETFIKLGRDNLFWKKENNRYNNLEEYWDFDNFAEKTRIKEIPFKANMNMFQLLGLNKQQFNLIFNNPNMQWNNAIEIINGVSWSDLIEGFPQDGWRSTDRKERAAYPTIPVEMFKQVLDIGIKLFNDGHAIYNITHLIQNMVRYGMDIKHLYKYVCIKPVNIETYTDYLRMRQCIIGYLTQADRATFERTWDKYLDDDTDVQFSHDRMIAYYNIWQAERARYCHEKEAEKQKDRQLKYDKRYKILKEFNYVEENDDHIVVVPKQLVEVITEGQMLHHCAGSFVESLAEGRDTLVFLRNKNTSSVPYVTVSLLYNSSNKEWFVDQAHTAYNGDITEEDVKFLKRWGAKNNVALNSIHTHYGAKCHH